jgi:hypothetical protein
MKKGESVVALPLCGAVVCKIADVRNLITVGEKYVVKLHWAEYLDVYLPKVNSWSTFHMENFYSVDEYREILLNELGI